MKFLKNICIKRLWESLNGLLKRVPSLVWGLLACTTIFVGGMLIGYVRGMQAENLGTPVYALREENTKLINLINGYTDLSNLYWNQGQDVSIVLNKDMLEKHPEEVTNALQSINQHRDMINVQLGRIFELRKAVGLVEYSGDSFGIKQ